MGESFDQQEAHRPSPRTSSRQAGHRVGSATSSAKPKMPRNGAFRRANRDGFTVLAIGPCMAAKLPLLCSCLNGGRDWLTPRAREVNTDMPGWDSLEAVTRIHGGAQLAGLVLLALLLVGAVLLVRQLRRSGWPECVDVGRYQVRSVAWEIAGAVLLVLLVAAALVAAGCDARRHTLMAAAEQTGADRLRNTVD